MRRACLVSLLGGLLACPAALAEPGLTPEAEELMAREAENQVVHPRLDLGVFWPVSPAGAATSRPAPTLGLALFQGQWGVHAETTIFGDTYVGGRAAPFFKADLFLTDVQLAFRSLEDPLRGTAATASEHEYGELLLGYRGIGLGDVNFGTLGTCFSWPLGAVGLSLRGRAVAGLTSALGYCADARLGVGVRARALEATVGTRVLALGGSGLPAGVAWGPSAELAVAF